MTDIATPEQLLAEIKQAAVELLARCRNGTLVAYWPDKTPVPRLYWRTHSIWQGIDDGVIFKREDILAFWPATKH